MLGKNFLYGKSSPTRLKMINTINDGSNEELDSRGRVKLSAAKPEKNTGTNQKAYQAHFCPPLYAVAAVTVRRKPKPMSDKPPLLK